jgi:hypothetical protein
VFATIDVPGKVYQKIARSKQFVHKPGEVFFSYSQTDKSDALFYPRCKNPLLVFKMYNRNIPQGHSKMLDENGQYALRHGTVPQHHYSFVEIDHVFPPSRNKMKVGLADTASIKSHSV